MADAGGEEILVVAGMAQQEHAHIVDQIAVRADVEVKVAAHAAARIDADGPPGPRRRMAGVFQRLPGHFQELAVLRIHDRRFLGRQAEELGIELLEILQRGGGAHVIGALQQMRFLARGQELLAAVLPDGLDPVLQVVPIRIRPVCARQVRCKSYYRDVIHGLIKPIFDFYSELRFYLELAGDCTQDLGNRTRWVYVKRQRTLHGFWPDCPDLCHFRANFSGSVSFFLSPRSDMVGTGRFAPRDGRTGTQKGYRRTARLIRQGCVCKQQALYRVIFAGFKCGICRERIPPT